MDVRRREFKKVWMIDDSVLGTLRADHHRSSGTLLLSLVFASSDIHTRVHRDLFVDWAQ